jgi:ubiquinone/menaquinone biosynthesis C-methylase UbiE
MPDLIYRRRKISYANAMPDAKPTPQQFWSDRAKQHGEYSVFNMRHPRAKIDQVTAGLKKRLTPYLQKHLQPADKTLLDFGCGYGRLTTFLAQFVTGNVYGADPTAELLEIAVKIFPPPPPRVQFLLLNKQRLDLPDKCIDVVFTWSVLGGITDDAALTATLAELKRITSANALFFLVENTARLKDSHYWHYRDEKTYQKLFDFVDLRTRGRYSDAGQRMSILIGRKISP